MHVTLTMGEDQRLDQLDLAAGQFDVALGDPSIPRSSEAADGEPPIEGKAG